MRLVARGADARRAVLEALIRLPETARGLALDSILFVVVGHSPGHEVRGWSIPASCYRGADWVVPLLAHDQIGNVVAHEVAHAVSGDPVASAERERTAAGLAREWGFDGHAADPHQCAADFESPAAAVHAVVNDDLVELRCDRCGEACVVLAPTAPGRLAELGAECDHCGRVDLLGLGDVVACVCGARAHVEWAPDATPERPTAIWTCTCGISVTRAILSAPVEAEESTFDLVVPGIDEPAWRFYARAARRVLAIPNGDLAWARHQLHLAIAELDGAPQRQHVQRALEALDQRDVAATTVAVAQALKPTS